MILNRPRPVFIIGIKQLSTINGRNYMTKTGNLTLVKIVFV